MYTLTGLSYEGVVGQAGFWKERLWNAISTGCVS